MKILEANAGALTNYEVVDFLRSKGAAVDSTRVLAQVSPSEYKVYDYLVQTAACNQTREHINEFVDKCKIYGLAKAEVLNIINIRPTSIIDIYTVKLLGKPSFFPFLLLHISFVMCQYVCTYAHVVFELVWNLVFKYV
ncbi:hypothetical protein ACB098_02G004500 [Castanea mollissima]